MEEYTIGSLSALITGSKKGSKSKGAKVIAKKFEILEKVETTETETIPKRLNKRKSLLNQKNLENDAEIVSNKKEKSKKRKILQEDIEEKEPPLKKTKYEENASRRVRKKEKTENIESNPEELARTIFVGNLPVTTKKDKLKKYFMKYGKVEAVRFRCVSVANPKTPKKVAIIKKEFHPERKSFNAYVRFETPEEATKATEANGEVYKEHHIRVASCALEKNKTEENKAIFVGNLAFNAEEEELWRLFEPCGAISYVRLVRDGRTGMGRGFGYVNFQNADSVTLALEMENVELKGREIRIKPCNIGAAKKNKNLKVKKAREPRNPRKREFHEEKYEPRETGAEIKNQEFQGAQFPEKKKKKSPNKGLLQKKRMIKKVAPKEFA